MYSIMQYFNFLEASSGSKKGNMPLQNSPAVADPPKVQDTGKIRICVAVIA